MEQPHGNQRPTPARIVAEAETAEESIEAVGSGLGLVLLAKGNAEIYRDDIVCRPVEGLSPGELAIAWRTSDDRPTVRVVIDACAGCLCDQPRTGSAGE